MAPRIVNPLRGFISKAYSGNSSRAPIYVGNPQKIIARVVITRGLHTRSPKIGTKGSPNKGNIP